MNRPRPCFLLPLGMLVATAHGAAQAAQARPQDPMRRYEELVAAARDAIAARDGVLAVAREEMRESNGELGSERATELTHHEELVEIAESRLLAYCQMHRLPVPDLSAPTTTETGASPAPRGDDPLHDSFRRALDAVRASFRTEARRIAAHVRLPAFRRPHPPAPREEATR